MDSQEQDRLRIDHRRLVAALHLRGSTLADVARSSGRTQRHLQFVLAGQRPLSAHLSAALRAAIGESAWPFVTGACDTFTDSPASEATTNAAA